MDPILIAAVAGVLVVGLVLYLVRAQWTGNFAAVVPGEVYRSNQPCSARLRRYVADHGIRSVLNLRGRCPGDAWYRAQCAVTQEMGVTLIDFSMSAERDLPEAKFKALLQVMRDAPKPMLIHCKSGADRTGLAAAIYLRLLAGRPPRVAGAQLSILYGHFSVPLLSRAWPMDRTWAKIGDWHPGEN